MEDPSHALGSRDYPRRMCWLDRSHKRQAAGASGIIGPRDERGDRDPAGERGPPGDKDLPVSKGTRGTPARE